MVITPKGLVVKNIKVSTRTTKYYEFIFKTIFEYDIRELFIFKLHEIQLTKIYGSSLNRVYVYGYV